MSLVLGMDTSGNLRFFGIILGEISVLSHIYSELTSLIKRSHIHMSAIKKNEKRMILNSLSTILEKKDVFAGCIKVDFQRRLRMFAGRFHSKKKAKNRAYREILVRVANICSYAGVLTTKIFEVHLDSELRDLEPQLRKFFPNASIVLEGFASELADIIAYANYASLDKSFVKTKKFFYIRM